MIFAIATTTLNKEVKRKLKTGQYSREEATFIYMEYLKLKKQRESGTKVAGISMAVIWGLMLVLPLLSGEGLVLPLSVHFLLLLLLAGIVLFVYYLMFGIFKQQIHSAMKEHYTDVIEEFKKNKENTKWKHGKS
ncbi:hypothetical protein GOM46_07245 [Streptococcus infantis]|uniref:hypothetical protein n=1 Tax=Streptococcus TaxID=1301 RepID=UPI0005105D9C|nr:MULTISPECIES: hypothetical protein [Streptococcus]KGF29898.1 hypothetical protein HMPREF2134_14790 [Peptoniphilus lacrimalis DNF00528]MBZ2120298.1 hypothetical protein [Streptococcus infantis]MBZ2121953.1 hypothetical protein [Streptococcus infantis]MBZ2126050.1 hypothetical protein [Streptococcus infantis]OFP42812.1 hypothetical protein HMPREF2987_06220 [Streptococcus sp. HMSC067H01]